VPIYAYKCTACGHAQDVLQKISDKTLTVCPECNQETYAKQVTAAGFQLKGSGWYVTDFRASGNGDKASSKTSEVAPAVTAASAESASSAPSAPSAATTAPAAPSAEPAKTTKPAADGSTA